MTLLVKARQNRLIALAVKADLARRKAQKPKRSPPCFAAAARLTT